jgi:hypothetical protein
VVSKWNGLPDEIKMSSGVDEFKRRLKISTRVRCEAARLKKMDDELYGPTTRREG